MNTSNGKDHVAIGYSGLLSNTSGSNHVVIGYQAKMVTPTADGFKPVIPNDSPQRTYPLLGCSYCGGGVPQDALKCVHCGAPPPGLGNRKEN